LEKTIFPLGLLIIVLLFLAGCRSKDSPEVQCLKEVSHNIKSIDFSSDNSDLTFLKKILDDDSVKIVLLGEQSHMDGTTFIAKAKLIKYLHEELGFNVLAFESGLYDCNKAWEFINNTKDYDWGLKNSIFGLWAWTEEFQDLTRYLQSTLNSPNPIILTGFDAQLSGQISNDSLLEDFDKLNLINKTSEDYKQLFSLLNTLSYSNLRDKNSKIDPSEYNKDTILLNSIISKLQTSSNSKNSFFDSEYWLHVIQGIKVERQYLYDWYTYENKGEQNGTIVSGSFTNPRDVQMGKNLLWLSNKKFNNKKIIVWAANGHIERNFQKITSPEQFRMVFSNTTTMGDVVYKELGRKIYSISFTDFENNRYMRNDVASDSTIEYSLEAAGFDYAFLNARNPNEIKCFKKNFFARFTGQQAEGEWSDITDGMFFIKSIEKSNIKGANK